MYAKISMVELIQPMCGMRTSASRAVRFVASNMTGRT